MTEELKLNMNEYLPLRDVVFHTLREAILRGDLRPGERLMEIQLANKMGVSRTPIREAIRMLEQEGLAVTMPRKGAEVAKMTLLISIPRQVTRTAFPVLLQAAQRALVLNRIESTPAALRFITLC